MAANTFDSVVLAVSIVALTALPITVAAGRNVVILQLNIANTQASGITVDVSYYDSSTTTEVYLVLGAPIPAGGALSIIDGQKIILSPGDLIKIKSNTLNGAHAVCSYMDTTI